MLLSSGVPCTPSLDGFTDSRWFLVAAAVVLVTVGSVLTMVAYNWGRNDAIRQAHQEDEAEIKAMQNEFYPAKEWTQTSDGFYVRNSCVRCGRAAHTGRCAEARALDGTAECRHDPCYNMVCVKHHHRGKMKFAPDSGTECVNAQCIDHFPEVE